MKFVVMAPDNAGVGAGGGAGDGAGTGSGAAASAGGAAAGAGAQAGAGAAGPAAGASAGANTSGASAASTAAAGTEGAGAGAAAGAADASASAAAPKWDADNWRGTWAGADDKKKAWAERRTDLKVALDSAYAADSKIAELSAAAKAVLPKDATPEQITAFRKDNGIPEKPEGYFDTLPQDVKLTDLEKAVLTPYLPVMQELNLPPAAAAKLVAVLQADRVRQIEARAVADDALKVKTEDALRADWGHNYRAEINNINGLLSGAPPEVREALFNVRTSDGTPFLGKPETVRWLAQLARTVNPYSVPVGGDGGALDQKGVEQRIAEITSWMGAPNGSPEYKRYWSDEKVQTEYRTLTEAREKMKQRAA